MSIACSSGPLVLSSSVTSSVISSPGSGGRCPLDAVLHGGPGLHAVGAEHVVGVGELARVLHEEAGLAHELAGALRLDAPAAVAAVVGLGLLVLVFALVLVGLGGDAVLEDRIEVGLDVVGVGLLVVLFLVLVVAAAALGFGLGLHGDGRGGLHHLFLHDVERIVVVGVCGRVVGGEVVLQLLGLVLEVFTDLLGVELLVGVVVCHRIPSRVGLARPDDRHTAGGGGSWWRRCRCHRRRAAGRAGHGRSWGGQGSDGGDPPLCDTGHRHRTWTGGA